MKCPFLRGTASADQGPVYGSQERIPSRRRLGSCGSASSAVRRILRLLSTGYRRRSGHLKRRFLASMFRDRKDAPLLTAKPPASADTRRVHEVSFLRPGRFLHDLAVIGSQAILSLERRTRQPVVSLSCLSNTTKIAQP